MRKIKKTNGGNKIVKIKDRIILGAISGILIAWPLRIVNAVEYKLGLIDMRYDHISSALFIPKKQKDTPGAIALGEIINIMNTGVVGVIMSYILSLTGRDKAIIKSIGVGSMSWVFINGLIANLGLKIKSKKPITPFLALFDHAIWGALCGLFISKFGDDSLFPDTNIRKQEKIPVVYTGTPQNNSIDKK
jgi:hypothetical protein